MRHRRSPARVQSDKRWVLTGKIRFAGRIPSAALWDRNQVVVSQGNIAVARQHLPRDGHFTFTLQPGQYSIRLSGPVTAIPFDNVAVVRAGETARKDLHVVVHNPAVTSQLPSSGTSVIPTGTAPCNAGSLTAADASHQGGGYVGERLIWTEFTNLGSSACFLSDIPEVRLLMANGSMLNLSPNPTVRPEQAVGLLPPGSADRSEWRCTGRTGVTRYRVLFALASRL
jgi:hypothetical protein